MSFYKNRIRIFQDRIDLCDKKKKLNDMSKVMLAGFGITMGCPVTERKLSCGNGRKVLALPVSTRKILKAIWADGDITKIMGNIVHDTVSIFK